MRSGRKIGSLRALSFILTVSAAVVLGPILKATARAGNTPGSSFSTFYDVSEDTGVGDNILRLVDPIGCPNNGIPNRVCGSQINLCAMLYIFDDDQEMGECCGCPITPNEVQTYSARALTSNWATGVADTGSGVIVVRSASRNNIPTCDAFTERPVPGCNAGCDPTFGYNGHPSLFGSITRPQGIAPTPPSLTELALFDNGLGDATNDTYLINQCAALIGNGSGGGICKCPSDETEGAALSAAF